MPILGGRKPLFLWIAAALIAIVLATLYLQVWRSQVPRRALYIVGNPERGAALFYGDKQCGICHSINGLGGRVAPDLSGRRPITPAMGWLVTVLWNHAPGMWRQIGKTNKAFPQLDPQETADILALLYQASTLDRTGDPYTGQNIFSEKGCSRCHSVNGAGGEAAPDLATISDRGDSDAWTRAMLNHASSMVVPITTVLGKWPQFSGDEMINLIAYVSQASPRPTNRQRASVGNAKRGWSVFQSRCMVCHSVHGQGGDIGPGLGPERDLPLTTAQLASLMWNHAPAMLQRGRESGIAPPQLQRNEMADLRTFLASLRYSEPTGSSLVGERVFSERGCAACHGKVAEGTRMGPQLKAHAEAYTTASFAAALWRHSPRMVDRAQESGLPWPILKATDIGDLVSFLNAPPSPK